MGCSGGVVVVLVECSGSLVRVVLVVTVGGNVGNGGGVVVV